MNLQRINRTSHIAKFVAHTIFLQFRSVTSHESDKKSNLQTSQLQSLTCNKSIIESMPGHPFAPARTYADLARSSFLELVSIYLFFFLDAHEWQALFCTDGYTFFDAVVVLFSIPRSICAHGCGRVLKSRRYNGNKWSGAETEKTDHSGLSHPSYSHGSLLYFILRWLPREPFHHSDGHGIRLVILPTGRASSSYRRVWLPLYRRCLKLTLPDPAGL